MELDREGPRNVEAEQALIGAALVNNDVLDMVRPLVEPAHFYDPLHAEIMRIMLDRRTRNEASSAVLLKTELGDNRALEDLGGPKYLAVLAGAAISTVGAKDYANTIRLLYAQRTFGAAMAKAHRALPAANEKDFAEVIEDVEVAIRAAGEAARGQDAAWSMARTIVTMIERVNDAYMADGAAGLTTGVAQVDEITGGMFSPEVWTIGARTSMGKSALALHMALAQARAGQGVLICTLEMQPPEMMARVASALCHERGRRIPYAALRGGRIGEDDMRFFIETVAEAKELPIIITPPSIRSSAAIMAEARAAAAKFERKGLRLGSIFVDYIQRVRVPGADGRVDEITEAMRLMKDMAVRHECAVIPVAQVNREVEGRAAAGQGSIPRPRISDLKGAGALEEESDVVILLHRDEYYLRKMNPRTSEEIDKHERRLRLAKDKAELFIDKFRGGPTHEVTVDFDVAVNRVLPRAEDNQRGFEL